MVWYNFLYHVDRNLEISKTLHAWATEVSQPYLQRYAPEFLVINTMDHSWKDHVRGEHDVMDIDSAQWTTVGSKGKEMRSKSPTMEPREQPMARNQGGSEDTITNRNQPNLSSNQTTTSEVSSQGKQSAFQPYSNVPTNDGTYRFTFKWTPHGDFQNYNEQSSTWLKEAHALMSDLFTDEDCSLYRWESTDLSLSNVMSELSPGDLREFLSPKVTFIASTSQIIFGARICFAGKTPGQWKNKERTRMALKDNQVSISISNSTTMSGRIVTAGYILLKAARTTHRTRFLQSLWVKLPSETPFFDILLFQRTPMEQQIPHLVVQCGENHVSPLSKALSELLSGHNSSLYLPRLALAKLSSAQISSYFDMQDKYSKSLKSLALFPTLTNLDKIRKEYYDDGTVVERSTREWADTIFSGKTDLGARCEVVNGGFDQKAYLLVPTTQFQVAKEHLRQYRLRINPIGRREARFRDSLPGLPTVIHIDTSTQHNLDFLAQISASEIWERAPSAVRKASPNNPDDGHSNFRPHGQGNQSRATAPSLSKLNNKKSRNNTPRLSSLGERDEDQDEPQYEVPGNDDQTTSTKSATQSLVTPSLLSHTTTRRLQELEAFFRNQQNAIEANAQMGKQMDQALQQTITTLQENSNKLVLTMERQQDTHVQLVELSSRVSRLTDVLDRMAIQIEALTTIAVNNKNQQATSENHVEGTRRRSIAEMSHQAASENGLGQCTTEKLSSTGWDAHTHDFGKTSTTDKVQSPNKKKSRQHQELSSHNLHSNLEEMSLGSDEHEQSICSERTERNQQPKITEDTVQAGMSLLDDASDDFSSTTTDDMPDLDPQYNFSRDPEGGDIR